MMFRFLVLCFQFLVRVQNLYNPENDDFYDPPLINRLYFYDFFLPVKSKTTKRKKSENYI